MPIKDVNKIIQYWLLSAEKEWRVLRKLLKQKEYVHVLISGHLGLEKYIKGIVVRDTLEHAPYSHDLLYLLGKTRLELFKEDEELLTDIRTFQGQGRYPDWELKFYKIADASFTKKYLKEMERLRKWFKSELSKKS